MFLAGLFITVPYSVSNLAFTITGKVDRKLPIVMNSFRHLHSSQKSASKIVYSIGLIINVRDRKLHANVDVENESSRERQFPGKDFRIGTLSDCSQIKG